MSKHDELFKLINEAYKEAATKGVTDVILFVMDNSSLLGRLASSNLPSVTVGIDIVCKDELAVAAFSAKAAIAMLKNMDEQYGKTDLSAVVKSPPPGHFWAISFSHAGKQLAPFPISK